MALGAANGSAVLAQILQKNPTFTELMTRLQVLLSNTRSPHSMSMAYSPHRILLRTLRFSMPLQVS